MNITATLLRVYRVDRQLIGLQGRLKGAQRFLDEQSKQLESFETKRGQAEKQLLQLKAQIGEQEGESARLEARISALREQMNSARTNKEYKALLTEVNTLKVEQDKINEAALGLMSKADELTQELDGYSKLRDEREKVRKVAVDDRDKHHNEIRERLTQLQAERAEVVKGVSAQVMAVYDELVRIRDGDAMSPVEVQDLKRHEFTCGGCMMNIPIEVVNGLLSSGKLSQCPSCRCILYVDTDLAERMQPAPSKR